jgi:hypothetical protein
MVLEDGLADDVPALHVEEALALTVQAEDPAGEVEDHDPCLDGVEDTTSKVPELQAGVGHD